MDAKCLLQYPVQKPIPENNGCWVVTTLGAKCNSCLFTFLSHLHTTAQSILVPKKCLSISECSKPACPAQPCQSPLFHAAFPDFISPLHMNFPTSALPKHLISRSLCCAPQPGSHSSFCVGHTRSTDSLEKKLLSFHQAW